MAQSTVHFAIGMIAGTAVALPRLVRRQRAGEPVAAEFARWFLYSYGLGALAIVPSVLRKMGVPDGVCDGWWMNVFLLYPLIGRLKSGGTLVGELLMGSVFGLQYGLMLLYIRSHRKRQGQAHLKTSGGG